MKDLIINDTGNSRFLRSNFSGDFAAMLAALQAGTFPVDFAGFNAAGLSQQGTSLSKNNIMPDALAAEIGLTGEDPTVADALSKMNTICVNARSGKVLLDWMDLSGVSAAVVDLADDPSNYDQLRIFGRLLAGSPIDTSQPTIYIYTGNDATGVQVSQVYASYSVHTSESQSGASLAFREVNGISHFQNYKRRISGNVSVDYYVDFTAKTAPVASCSQFYITAGGYTVGQGYLQIVGVNY